MGLGMNSTLGTELVACIRSVECEAGVVHRECIKMKYSRTAQVGVLEYLARGT